MATSPNTERPRCSAAGRPQLAQRPPYKQISQRQQDCAVLSTTSLYSYPAALDKGYMKLLKYEWKKAYHEFTRENNGHHVDKISFARVFSKAHLAMAKALTIFNAFRSCGILPVCPDVINYK